MMTFSQSPGLQSFARFYDAFRNTQKWAAMQSTREDSVWHREDNVAVHTQMLINWYLEHFASQRDDKQRVLSLVACLFHDVGKPLAQVTKFSKERGEYRAYHGHEQLSARMWVDYALSNFEQIEALQLTLHDVSNIALMLEYHVPFAITNPNKKRDLKTALVTRLGESGHRAWLDFLLCDQNGRISDNKDVNLAAVDMWLDNWSTI